MLEMRAECEKCHTALPEGADAFVCSFECTFCPGCTGAMAGSCPNCAGELVKRPRRGSPAVPAEGGHTTHDALLAAMPFAQTMGMQLLRGDAARADATVDWAEGLCTTAGAMHGGVLMALADTIGAVVAFHNLPKGANTTTVSSSTVFLKGVRDGQVHATATPVRAGKKIIVVRTDITDSAGHLVSQTTQSQAVL